MGLFETILGSKTASGDDGDYIELNEENLKAPEQGIDATIHLADIRGQQDLMAVKDALYGGDIVLADLNHADAAGMNVERVRNILRETINEIGGDVVKDGSNQLILAPAGVKISREKLE